MESSIYLHIVNRTMKRTNKYLFYAVWINQEDLTRVSCCWTTQSLTASRPRLVAWILQDCVTLLNSLPDFFVTRRFLEIQAVIYTVRIYLRKLGNR
jgi:hypothetical protein